MAFELPPLPYPKDALAPHMSAETLDFHHDKHHRAYVTTLNKLIEGSALANASLEDIMRKSANDEKMAPIFNNAAQTWNHTFFWNSMKPRGGGKPSDQLASRLDQAFEGLDNFRAEFKKAAEGQFGSGWAWLVLDRGKLKVVKTANADTPLVHRQAPLVACDVWEHAYYIDYRNRRGDFVQVFLDHLINWEFVARNIEQQEREKAA
jgi:superoxide dismutase, Fe-Mn family